MNTIELKETLHQFISETNDMNILNKIKAFFQEVKDSTNEIELTPYEEKLVAIGMQQIEEGRIMPHHEARQKIKQLLKEKRQ